MRKVLLALSATFAVCLAVFAGTTMCVKKQNGDILRINVDDVYEVYFEDIFNPDTSSIIPPFIEPTVADTSAYAPLRFRITSDSTVELTDGNYRDLDSVNIPAKVKIDGKVYSVTKIGDYALCPKYSDCYGLISVAIPSSVTSIGYDAFSGCSSLTTIEIPSSVTSIGSYAFAWCENLDVVIDNSRKNIEIRMNAFIDCHSLTFKKDPIMDSSVDDALISSFDYEILADSTAKIIEYHYYDYDNKIDSMTMPSKVVIDNNIYNVSSVGGHTFMEIEAPSHIIIPEGITSIVDYAFRSVLNLKSVSLPSSVTSIGSEAFRYCSSLESINVDVKNPNYSSLDGIFYNKEKTEIIAVPNGIKGSISIPESVTSIGSEAFYGCSSLTSVEIPSSVTSIGSDAFRYCSSMTSVEIPSSVTSIGSEAFRYCSSMTSVEIPSSVTSIGERAFADCSSLTSIEIPSSVTSIGSEAFRYCSSLESINVDVKNPNYSSLDGIFYNKEKTEIIAVPKGIKGSISIPSSVTSIGSEAFSNCSSLTSIAIPSSVTSIGSSAFRYCSSMTSVEIPSSVTSIGSNAFRDCKNLDVVIDNSKENVKFYNYWEKETTIENSYAFEGVKSVKWLKEIDEDPSVADTSAYAPLRFEITSDSTAELTREEYWDSYEGLDSVNIPAKVKIDGKVYSVTSIGGYAFLDCRSLTSIEIPSSVTSIGEDAFYGCWSLTSIEIPSSVTEIGSYAFAGCGSLTSVEIPSSVTSIGEDAFLDCSSLTSIEIPSSVTSIGEDAFYGCWRLTSIEIPSSVTEIGSYAFRDCSSLESINVDAKNPNYSSLDGVVYNKEKTEIIAVPEGIKGSISIPSSVTEIGERAFYSCSSLTSVEIPSSVTEIGSYAFYGCENLDIVIDNSEENVKVGVRTFKGVKSVKWLK